MQHKSLVLFDLAVGGHHGTYLWHIAKRWSLARVPGTLNLVVAPQFLEQHLEVVDLVKSNVAGTIQLLPILSEEAESLCQQKSFLKRIFLEWTLFCHYAGQTKADQAMLMQFDHLQLPMVFGERSPCPISGIYFRPTLHYTQFSHYTSTTKDRVRRWRQKLLLALALKSGQMNTLFSLDPFAPAAIAPFAHSVQVVPLPDPVERMVIDPVRSHQLKIQLNLAPNRRIFLLFGKLSSRKGTHQLLEAVRQLPMETSQKLCVLMVGEIPDSEAPRLKSLISEVTANSSAQILLKDEFIPESDAPLYFQLADVVLAPYQQHVGTSGILLQAAAAQKPVLSSDYGLMGELVRQYELGLVTDTQQPNAISQTISKYLQHPDTQFANPFQMKAFVEQNLADKFAETILRQLIFNAIDNVAAVSSH